MQGSELVASGDGGVGLSGFLAGAIGAELDDGVEGRVDLVDAGEVRLEHLGS